MEREIPLKPSWDDAPDWAQGLGICDMEYKEYYGEWCWLQSPNSAFFTHIEARPLEYQ